MKLAVVLDFLTVLVLAAATPVAVIAARGFSDAPFGRVLRPLPFVFGLYVLLNAPSFLPVDPPLAFYAVVSTLAVLGVLIAATEAALLLTGRRAV